MRKAFFGALACAGLGAMSASLAQPYPTRAVTLMVPYGAGGPLDTLTRIVSDRMRVSLGQPIVIENITGASGVIGVGRAVRAEPDGYTVSVGNWPTHVVNGAAFALPYDLLRDLEPVALLSSNPYLVVARNGLPAKNLAELIAVLKANPDKLTLGTAGPGSGQHVGGLYFQSATGTALRFVPYRAGSSDIMKDLVGGHIDLTFDQAAARAINQDESGSANDLSRRTLMKVGATLGGGLMLSLTLPFGNGEAETADADGCAPNAFIRIDRDGQVVLTMP